VTKKVCLSLAIALTLAVFIWFSAYACGNNGKCEGKNCKCLEIKGAKVEATNIGNGVMVQITSDDPKTVKKIQDKTAKCKCEGKQDAQCEVTKIDNGATIKITSTDPEMVKQIQECHANCMKSGKKDCSKECTGPKSGKCPGHK